MQLTLKTYRDSQSLIITDVTKDSFVLQVNSGGYAGVVLFHHYNTAVFDDFIANMAALAATNSGAATLVDVEDNQLRFSLDVRGHLEVSGRLIPHTIPYQELQFGFITDQTCLASFIADLKKARHEAKN